MRKSIYSLLLGALLLSSCATAKYGCPSVQHSSGYVQSHSHSTGVKGIVVATGFGVR
jgi:hypothetical protein